MITQLKLDKDFFFNEADAKGILLSREWAQIHIFCVKKILRKKERRSDCLLRIRRRVSKLPQPSVLLANVQSLENKMDDLRSRLSNQWDIKNCNVLCFTLSWLNDDTDNIGTTKTLPRAGRLAKLSNQGKRALVREVTKITLVTLTELQNSAVEMG